MRIENMFQEDINRKINGVVKVDQDTADVLKQAADMAFREKRTLSEEETESLLNED